MLTGQVSYWLQETGGIAPRRAALSGPCAADVCIIGAGFTGLWAAHYLTCAAPDLRVVVLERAFAGFGASGRNGGWVTGGFAWSHARYAAARGAAATRAMVAAMEGTVGEITVQASDLGLADCLTPTDELTLATNPAQLARMQADHAQRLHWGETRVRLLSREQTQARITVPDALGAMLTEGVARVQPARLVRGLATALEARGVTIFEGSEVHALHPGRVVTAGGEVRARVILRCTEGYGAGFAGHRRDLLPLNSAQIITAPLPDAVWQDIGWQGAELLGDFAHVYCYAQRTPDGRIVMGGRGTPYRFGSRTDTDGAPDQATIGALVARLHRHFPAARGVGIAHAWCGVLGVPRDWCARVGFDAQTGMGWAGGYVGVGVSTSNLAGRILSDLVLGRDSDLARLPLVNLPLRRWEREPLRWLGVRGMYALMARADAAEARGARASALVALAGKIMGRG